jgi:hypothetical protein
MIAFPSDAVTEAQLVSGAGKPINSQETGQFRRVCEQNDGLDWRFD